jgi:hypothetical protein
MRQNLMGSTWRLLLPLAAFALFASCSDGSKVPVSPEPGVIATGPLFDGSAPPNGTGACLTEDTENAGFINNVGDLNCTSQDVDIAVATAGTYSTDGGNTFVTLASTGGKILCNAGQNVLVNTSAQVINHAQARYDVGLWIGEAGGDAKNGAACLHFNLVAGLNNSTNLDLQTGDQCGDVAANVTVDVPLGTLSLTCVDGDPDPAVQALVISACAGWLNSVAPGTRDGICPVPGQPSALGFRYGTTPETSAKCKCEPLSLPLDVRGTITIVKNTVGGNATFQYTHNVGSNSNPVVSTPFNITTVAGTGSQLFEKVAAGTYTVTETDPTSNPGGWDFTSLICSDANSTVAGRVATIVLEAGENVTCTYTNTQRGSITVIKNAIPDDPQNFVFAGNITGCTAFTLDDDADATLSNTQGPCAVAPGTFNVDETVPAGWAKTSAVCSDGSPITAIAVAAGENVTCTFTNTKNGSITVIKNAIPDDPQNFVFAGNITGCTAFTLDDDADATLSNTQGPCAVAPGTFNVDETVPAGWAKTSAVCSDGSPITAIAVAAGENVTCTFTNTKNGSITVIKNAIPDDPQNFVFAGNITGCTAFTLDDDADATLSNTQGPCAVAPGTFNVDETVPAGWAKTSAVCSDGSPITAIAVAAGENVTCTFTNTKNGSITVIKNAIPDDPQNFVFAGNITGCTAFTLDDDADATLSNTQGPCAVAPGTFNVDETVPAGWAKTSAVCSDGSPITAIAVAAGENVTCTFTNTKNGSITVIKNAIPDDPQNFVFAGNITGCTAFTLDDDADATLSNTQGPCAVAPGTFNVDETVPAGWAKTSAVCSDGSPITAIAVAAGENVTCTFTNTELSTIIIEKEIVGGGPELFTFTRRISPSTVDAGDNPNPTLGHLGSSSSGKKLAAGTYRVCETNLFAGWFDPTAAGYTLVSDGLGNFCATFALAAGETKTIHFVNQRPPGGGTRTIGYWKNWSSCGQSNGKQYDKAIAAGEPEATLDFYLGAGSSIYPLGDITSLTCEEAVNLLSKNAINGEKRPGDPIYNMVAQLLGAKLNLAAGAGGCAALTTALTAAQTFLDNLGFVGTGSYKDSLSATDKALVLGWAGVFGSYNEGTLGGGCPTHA